MEENNKTTVNMTGDNAKNFVFEGSGPVSINMDGRYVRSLADASLALRTWHNCVYKDKHIARKETQELLSWLEDEQGAKKENRVRLLVGDAGSGKSVVMQDVLLSMETNGIPVLGLKSDQLFSIKDKNIDELVGLEKPVTAFVKEMADKGKFVFLVDQIDALSSTLSNDRTSLRSMNTLIDDVSNHPNVRVIVSCRPYDLHFDPALEKYRYYPACRMDLLPVELVDETLSVAGIELKDNETVVKNFLRNPLNLFLFCHIKDNRLFSNKKPNRTILYDALWKKVIDECEAEKVTSESLCNCLNYITDAMYNDQVLAVSNDRLYTKFAKEESYLLSNHLLYVSKDDSSVLFLHQSLYDYIYSRLFYTQGKTIDEILGNGQHQGLFLRFRLKQVMSYIHDIDEGEYLKNLKQLLTGERYRYHLKHMMVTNIAYQDYLSAAEKNFIIKYILGDSFLRNLYIDSVSTPAGLDFLAELIDKNGGFLRKEEKEQIRILNMCEKVSYFHADYVIDYLLTLPLDRMVPEVHARMVRILNGFPLQRVSIDKVLAFIEKVVTLEDDINLDALYMNVAKVKPQFVADRLVNQVHEIAKTCSLDNHDYRFTLPQDVTMLLDRVKETDPKVAFICILSMLDIIGHATVGYIKDSEIKASYVYLSYKYHEMYPSNTDQLLDTAIDLAVSFTGQKDQDVLDILAKLAVSDLAINVLIPVIAYKEQIAQHIDDAYALLTRIMTLEVLSSVLDYHTKELFRCIFPLLDKKRRDDLMYILEKMNPSWEQKALNKENTFRPISYIGYTKGQYYKLLPESALEEYPKAKEHLAEMERKFYSLENQEPNQVKSMVGWRTMSADAYSKMSVQQMVNTMCQIAEDGYLNWDNPTKTGHAFALRDHCQERPDDYYEAYTQALEKGADLDYILYGIEGLLKCNYDIVKVNSLVETLLSTFNTPISNNSASHVIQAVRLVDHYHSTNNATPEVLFRFVCNAAKNWDDSEYFGEKGDMLTYQDGVNQVRGAAASNLIECDFHEEWKEPLFEALYAVADNGAVSTRGAMLFRMAVLLNLDQNRTFELFKRTLHDYATQLMRIELHNLNPIVYLINNHFAELKDYFEAAIKNEKTHDINVVTLWLAWVRGKDGADQLMWRMADASITAKAALVKAVYFYFSPRILNHILPVLERYMEVDDKDCGSQYDFMFIKINQWPVEKQLEYVSKFVKTPACKYCGHSMIDYLEKAATKHPHECLSWLPDVFEKLKQSDQWNFTPNKYVDILISAYNSICVFDKEDEILERAMDMLDIWVRDDYNRQYLNNYLKMLED